MNIFIRPFRKTHVLLSKWCILAMNEIEKRASKEGPHCKGANKRQGAPHHSAVHSSSASPEEYRHNQKFARGVGSQGGSQSWDESGAPDSTFRWSGASLELHHSRRRPAGRRGGCTGTPRKDASVETKLGRGQFALTLAEPVYSVGIACLCGRVSRCSV